MNSPIASIRKIQEELEKLSLEKSFSQAQRVIFSVIELLDPAVADKDPESAFQLFTDSDGKIRANAGWFFEDKMIADRKAVYKIHGENALGIDFKAYGVNKASKRIVSWATGVTPNFEDEAFNGKFNVGIDFVVPKSCDRVIVVLTNNYVVRTLELKGTLTATYQEILAKWASIKDFSNKKAFHSILWESFDLQPLNKKFYAGISERFILLRQHLEKEGIFDQKHASYFSNRLMGRVIFCWFLDHKNVLNAEKKYFDAKAYPSSTDYYRGRLETLFYRVLNTPVGDREPMVQDEVTPFLNGGLFEPRATDLFENPKLTFPKSYFDDLFEFLSGYNFTTDESTSQFQQVAIDPEMLGRIFENLLAEMTEETGEQARKAKGAFYTPREIVDYMCRESLREYLKTKLPEDEFRDQRLEQLIDRPDKEFQDQDHNWRRDWKPYKDAIIKALDELTVLDPACGSGAFPIGMMQLLVQVYTRLDSKYEQKATQTKLRIVGKNLYGVDIEPMAVEIARLRAWLSIIVDEDADSKKIKPLPNLEFKFICANSLIDLDQNGETPSGGKDHNALAKELRTIRDAYFNTESLNKKKTLREKYNKLINEQEGLFGESTRSKQLKTYRPFDNEWSAGFFNPEFMFGTDEFNIIIGNPPYIGERGNESIFQDVSKSELGKRFYTRWMDYFYFFFHFALDKGSNSAVIAFITTNYYITATGGILVRNDLNERADILRMINFNEFRIFESALGQHNIITIFSKRNTNSTMNDRRSAKNCITKKKGLAKFNDLRWILEGLGGDTSYFDVAQEDLYDGLDFQIRINGTNSINDASGLNSLLEKIKQDSVPLGSIVKITTGIVTLSDTVSNRHIKQFPGMNASKGDGIYVLSNDELKKLGIEGDDKKYIKPFFKNSDIKRYYSKTKNELWLIYIKDEGVPIHLDVPLSEHFEKFRDLIYSLKSNFLKNEIAASIVRNWFKNGNYFVLFTPKKKEYFVGPKIVAPYRSKVNAFSYNEIPWFSSKDVAFILLTDEAYSLKYILSILNSKLVYFWLYHKGKKKGETLELYQKPLSEIPIKRADNQQPFIELVDRILDIKIANPSADTSGLEEEVNQLVYQLYGLTDEEMKIVEGN